MIYKLVFSDGQVDWCTAKDPLHLLKSYDEDFDLAIQEIEVLQEISEEEAKGIMVRNSEYDEEDPEDDEEICLWELAIGDDFVVIASSEFQ